MDRELRELRTGYRDEQRRLVPDPEPAGPTRAEYEKKMGVADECGRPGCERPATPGSDDHTSRFCSDRCLDLYDHLGETEGRQ